MHAKSEAAFQRAQQVIPGGVNSPVRAFRGVGGTPPFIARGEGSHIFDIDGNEYIDYVGSWGPLLLGHRHPAIVEAVRQALETGTSFGAPTERETDLAEAIRDAAVSYTHLDVYKRQAMTRGARTRACRVGAPADGWFLSQECVPHRVRNAR